MGTVISELFKLLMRLGLLEFLKRIGWKAALWVFGLILALVVAVVVLIALLIILIL